MGLEPIGGGSGIDTENLEPGEAVIYAGDGEFTSQPVDISRDTVTFQSGDNEVFDVSDIVGTERVVVSAANGSSGDDADGGDGGDGGSGCELVCDVDFTDIDEIEVDVASGRGGYRNGESGESSSADGGNGGGSSAILVDGDVIAEAGGGGGGGGGGFDGSPRNQGDGGDGGGSSGIGGSGGDGGWSGSNGDDGGNGSYRINDDDFDIEYVSDGSSDGGMIRLFD